MVVYAPLIDRTVNLMPIFAASDWMTGTIRLSSARVSAIISTPLQADAVHLPEPPEYFDFFISACAFVTSPEKFGVAYGSYSARPLLYIAGGAMCVPIAATIGPPQAFRSACLSMM
jgi:hypothetical protein